MTETVLERLGTTESTTLVFKTRGRRQNPSRVNALGRRQGDFAG
jgi:hypothetical protein